MIDRKAYRILVIEDNPGDFVLIEDFLLAQNTSVHITHAVTFKEAKSKLLQENLEFDIA